MPFIFPTQTSYLKCMYVYALRFQMNYTQLRLRFLHKDGSSCPPLCLFRIFIVFQTNFILFTLRLKGKNENWKKILHNLGDVIWQFTCSIKYKGEQGKENDNLGNLFHKNNLIHFSYWHSMPSIITPAMEWLPSQQEVIGNQESNIVAHTARVLTFKWDWITQYILVQ